MEKKQYISPVIGVISSDNIALGTNSNESADPTKKQLSKQTDNFSFDDEENE